MGTRRNMLHSGVRFALFATSYSPLFLLMILKIFFTHASYLKWGGFSQETILNYLKYFGLSTVLIGFMIIGSFGLLLFLTKIQRSADVNGFPVVIKDVKNKNSEAISYIGTYIIPFLFQNYSEPYEIISISILLVVVYFIYINSTLILINPVLNLWYSLYEVEFVNQPQPVNNNKNKNGLIITRDRFLEEEDHMMFRRIGHKLYFGLSQFQEDK